MIVTYCSYCHSKIGKSPNPKLQREYEERQNSYPYNLYYDIFRERVRRITPEFEQKLNLALAALTDYERDLIKQKYVEHRELSATAFVCGQAVRKLRQLINKAKYEKGETQ